MSNLWPLRCSMVTWFYGSLEIREATSYAVIYAVLVSVYSLGAVWWLGLLRRRDAAMASVWWASATRHSLISTRLGRIRLFSNGRREALMDRRSALTAIGLTIVLVLSACGASSFATSLRIVVAAGAPILNTLEAQGKISHDLRVGLITDLTNEAGEVSNMATCFDAIPKDDAQSKPKHLQCVQTLASSATTKKLLSDFGSNNTVSMIADDFEAVLEGAIIFYGGVTKNAARASRTATTAPVVTEADIKARIAHLKKDLGQ